MFDQLYAQVPEVTLSVPSIGVLNVTPYLTALALFLVLLVAFRIVHQVLLARLERFSARTATKIDDILIRVVRRVRVWAYTIIALTLSLKVMVTMPWLDRALTAVLLFTLFLEVVRALTLLIDYAVSRHLVKSDEEGAPDPNSETAVQMLSLIARIVLWVVGFLFILSNLGIEITSLIAGLGIGGIAIGLALQAILGDLFSSFAIYFDKPFKVGDFIIVGDTLGTVERIGIKTTRLRALQGEEIVISNAELTSSRIHNYKRMAKRRIVFSFGVTYETPYEIIKRIPQLVAELFDAVENTELERAHFASFGDSALNFEVVYYVLASDYTMYMDIQQDINLKIMEIFARENVSFAHPTQTLYVHAEQD